MSIQLVYRNDIPNELKIPKEVLPESGVPFGHHFQSTPQDNLIELAGRICYDSCKSEKTRSSADYHKHINEVGHGSVQEHCNLTFETEYPLESVLIACVNRPGVWIDRNQNSAAIRITTNMRAIKEWPLWRSRLAQFGSGFIGWDIQTKAKKYAPLTLADITSHNLSASIIAVKPIFPEEIWLSFYISEVSRGLSHEWVRHKYQTAISQRSTRYVDESESNWVWHPLILKYQKKIENSLHNWACYDKWVLETLSQNINAAQGYYETMVSVIERELVSEGVDKFTARKQARGAARGVLGNALSTEMIWSGSLAQIIRIIKQRATEAADAEIRLLANELYEIVQPLYPQYFVGCTTKPCPDGIGYSVLWK